MIFKHILGEMIKQLTNALGVEGWAEVANGTHKDQLVISN